MGRGASIWAEKVLLFIFKPKALLAIVERQRVSGRCGVSPLEWGRPRRLGLGRGKGFSPCNDYVVI